MRISALDHGVEIVGILFVAIASLEPRDERLNGFDERFVGFQLFRHGSGLVIGVMDNWLRG